VNRYLQRLKENSRKTPPLGTDRTDKRASVSSVGSDGSHFSENSSEAVSYRTAGAACDLSVPAGRVVSFEAEVRRRNLIRFNLRDHDGDLLPGFSVEMPRPGESRDECIVRLRAEFGGRFVLDDDEVHG
jgi:hypothetical protein